MQRVMVFIDGENLCFRSRNLLQKSNCVPTPGSHYIADSFIWFSNITNNFSHDPVLAGAITNRLGGQDGVDVIRASYYTSISGDEVKLREVQEVIWNLKMHPVIFKKHRKHDKAKGVDIALTKDMLVHAFQDNYDIAVLITGDGDYIPVIEEVKRQGKRVVLQFLNEKDGLNPRLRLTCDAYLDITALVQNYWFRNGTRTDAK